MTDLDRLAAIKDLQGENAVLRDILKDALLILKTIEPENTEEAERLSGVTIAIEYALSPPSVVEGALMFL